MNISIFGLGYVGCVGAACLAHLGHNVIGVDVSQSKVDLINEGRPTIIEQDIEQLCQIGHRSGRLRATTDVQEAIDATDISFIAVGTPSTPEGHLNLEYIYAVARQIGMALRHKNGFHVIAIRSTVLPGTNKRVGEIIMESSGKERNVDFAVVSNPEFLREGTSVHDFLNPPLTLIGSDSQEATDMFRTLYKEIPADFIETDIRVAEIMKYVNNTFHALKIVFGNEIGNICKALDIDSHKVMDIFCRDRQLNISPYYFKPGFAYGGSCLPKDTKALRTLARDNYIDVPVIEHIEKSNELQKQKAVKLITKHSCRNIGILGLSFKAGTDDLRCSPIVDVVETLLGKGFNIKIYDKNVKISELTGTNREFIMAKIPHLQHFVTDNIDEVISASDVIVVTNKEAEFDDILSRYPGKIIVDLVRAWKDVDYNGVYEGLSWGNINSNATQNISVNREIIGSEY
ncbi:MAG: UDP-glucose/GDP-mannose dehydrogenase family protein [Muribaculaceae bacterium]|nr:UDP-glucose/GDP-mannose dehydrogenase family protein [Muribaculaceae bacterium]